MQMLTLNSNFQDMTLLELPGPILAKIVANIVDLQASDSWKVLSLVCKTLCARASSSATKLRLQVDGDLLHKAKRCLERGFRVDTLYLVAASRFSASVQGQSAATTVALLKLFQLPLWSHLRTLRVRDLNMPEAVLALLPGACPNLQELFLEGLVIHDNHYTDNVTIRTYASEENPTVPYTTVTISPPQEEDAHIRHMQLCSIACSTTQCFVEDCYCRYDYDAPRVAGLLSELKQLRLLRMHCTLARHIMQELSWLHNRPCLEDIKGSAFTRRSSGNTHSSSQSCKTDQPLLSQMPLLGWYLFNVTGAPCSTVSGRNSDVSTGILCSDSSRGRASNSSSNTSTACRCEASGRVAPLLPNSTAAASAPLLLSSTAAASVDDVSSDKGCHTAPAACSSDSHSTGASSSSSSIDIRSHPLKLVTSRPLSASTAEAVTEAAAVRSDDMSPAKHKQLVGEAAAAVHDAIGGASADDAAAANIYSCVGRHSLNLDQTLVDKAAVALAGTLSSSASSSSSTEDAVRSSSCCCLLLSKDCEHAPRSACSKDVTIPASSGPALGNVSEVDSLPDDVVAKLHVSGQEQ